MPPKLMRRDGKFILSYWVCLLSNFADIAIDSRESVMACSSYYEKSYTLETLLHPS